MTSETRCINRFVGNRGLLSKNDGTKTTDVQDIEITEYGEYIRSPSGESVVLYRSWVDVKFNSPDPTSSIYEDLITDTSTVQLYSLNADGRLNNSELAIAKVSDLYLKSLSHGEGKEVTFSQK
jgi:hypothetical protein